MKKLPIISIMLVSILLTSCAKSTVLPENTNALIDCFGQDKSKILEVMQLSEQEARDTSSDSDEYKGHAEVFPLKQRQEILGEDFMAFIMLLQNDIVYGMRYDKVYEGRSKEGIKLAKEIDEKLAEKYEVDSSFAGTRVLEIPSYDEITEREYYVTSRVYNEKVNVSLTVDVGYIDAEKEKKDKKWFTYIRFGVVQVKERYEGPE